MSKVTKDGDTNDFEDFGYDIKKTQRWNKRRIPKYKKEDNTAGDTS